MKKLTQLIEYSFYLLIILLPWQTRLIWRDFFINSFVWEYGRYSLYGIELFLLFIFLLYGIWLVKSKGLVKINFDNFFVQLKKPPVAIYWLVILFALLAGVSIIFSLSPELAYIKWIQLLEAIAVFSVIVVFAFDVKKVAWAWMISSIIQSIFAIWQFFVQYTPANKWLGLAYHLPTLGGAIILETTSERWLRAYGSFPHPNILAGFLLIGLLFLLYLAFNSKSSKLNFFLAISLAVIVAALFFTFSRSAWVAAIIVFALLTFWLYRHKHFIWRKTFFELMLLVLIVVSALGVTLSEPFMTRILGVQPLEVNSIELRFTFTEQALQLIKNNFWTGTGLGNYTLGVYQQIDKTWPGYYYQPVHNIYLLTLAELGVTGFIVFILLLALLLYFLKKSATSLEKTILGLAFVTILVIGLFDHYSLTLFSGILMFWIILAFNLKNLQVNPNTKIFGVGVKK